MLGWEYGDDKLEGLKNVASVDWLGDEANYDWFDTTILYDAEENKFYWAHEGGCSCDGPMEFVTERSQLKSGSVHDIARFLQEELSGYNVSEKYREYLENEVARGIEACLRVECERG
jgi:hypothetical protein